MIIFECLSLLVLICLGVYASVSDIQDGIIKNRVLAAAALYAVLADGIYYGLWCRELVLQFLVNSAVVSALALVLFFTHSWAGGDRGDRTLLDLGIITDKEHDQMKVKIQSSAGSY